MRSRSHRGGTGFLDPWLVVAWLVGPRHLVLNAAGEQAYLITEYSGEVFRLDPFAAGGAETGATRVTRSLILPERPFQVLSEKDPEGFRALRKFVVGKEGRVLVYG